MNASPSAATASAVAVSLPWDEIDTVLVDMDGTLLDLAFDNIFWHELVPAIFAETAGITVQAARQEVMERSRRLIGTLEWYCLDHWGRELGLNLAALKRSHRHLIRYLPRAPEFLGAAQERGKALSVVTNAHRDALDVKVEHTGLNGLVDTLVSSHDFRAAKESREFWVELGRRSPFDPRRTVLIEDSVAVLSAARAFGIRHTIAVARPDSRLPRRDIGGFPNVEGVAELL
jgi:5'-nucleotidase